MSEAVQASSKAEKFSSYQLLLLIGLVLLLFTIVVDYMLLGSLSAVLLEELGLSPQHFSYLLSAYGFSAAISSLVAAGLADRFDRKPFLLVFYGGFLVGLGLCALSTSYAMLLAARIITGTFGGVVGAICLSIVADQFSAKQRGRVLGLVQLAYAAAQILGLPAAMWMGSHFFWKLPYWSLLLFGLAIILPMAFKMRSIRGHLSQARERNAFKHMARSLRQRSYWAVFSNNSLIVMGDGILMAFNAAYMASNLGLGLETLPMVYGAIGLTGVVCGPLFGLLADKLGKLPVFTLGTLLSVVAVAIYTQLNGAELWLVITLHVLLFAGVNARMVAATALGLGVPQSQDRGTFMSFDASLQQLAGAIAATLAGFIIIQSADGPLERYPWLGAASIALMLLTSFLVFRISRLSKEG